MRVQYDDMREEQGGHGHDVKARSTVRSVEERAVRALERTADLANGQVPQRVVGVNRVDKTLCEITKRKKACIHKFIIFSLPA